MRTSGRNRCGKNSRTFLKSVDEQAFSIKSRRASRDAPPAGDAWVYVPTENGGHIHHLPEDTCLKELVRYIHLKPLRTGIVSTVSELNPYACCGTIKKPRLGGSSAPGPPGNRDTPRRSRHGSRGRPAFASGFTVAGNAVQRGERIPRETDYPLIH